MLFICRYIHTCVHVWYMRACHIPFYFLYFFLVIKRFLGLLLGLHLFGVITILHFSSLFWRIFFSTSFRYFQFNVHCFIAHTYLSAQFIFHFFRFAFMLSVASLTHSTAYLSKHKYLFTAFLLNYIPIWRHFYIIYISK